MFRYFFWVMFFLLLLVMNGGRKSIDFSIVSLKSVWRKSVRSFFMWIYAFFFLTIFSVGWWSFWFDHRSNAIFSTHSQPKFLFQVGKTSITFVPCINFKWLPYIYVRLLWIWNFAHQTFYTIDEKNDSF